MNVIFGYKDYMLPDFFQGPSYILFKERSKIKNHKYPEEKIPEDDDFYEVAPFPPVKPMPENEKKSSHKPNHNEPRPEGFDIKEEKRKGNKFWNDLDAKADSNPSASKKK